MIRICSALECSQCLLCRSDVRAFFCCCGVNVCSRKYELVLEILVIFSKQKLLRQSSLCDVYFGMTLEGFCGATFEFQPSVCPPDND